MEVVGSFYAEAVFFAPFGNFGDFVRVYDFLRSSMRQPDTIPTFNVPYFDISTGAVLGPMPITPGILSAASPTRARYSLRRPGGIPGATLECKKDTYRIPAALCPRQLCGTFYEAAQYGRLHSLIRCVRVPEASPCQL